MIRFNNNASSLLAGPITTSSTEIVLEAGKGSLFPVLTGQDVAICVLEGPSGQYEVVRAVARTVDTLEVVRAQEGTIAQEFPLGSRIELRLTAGVAGTFVQRTGDVFEDLTIATLQTTQTTADRLIARFLRGVSDLAKVLTHNAQGRLASADLVDGEPANLRPLMTSADFPAGVIVLWYGAATNVPAGWVICDGTNGTPDMRNRVPRGSSNDTELGASGGADTASLPSHTHPITVAGHALTVSQIPAHSHREGGNLLGGSAGTTEAIQNPLNQNLIRPGSYGSQNDSWRWLTEETGGGQAHSHSASSGAPSTSPTINTVPTHIKLHFIMRIA